MAQDDVERSEPATPKRREDARKKGQVAQSREVVSVAMLAALVAALLSALGVELARVLVVQSRATWAGSSITPSSLADFHAVLLQHTVFTAAALLPVLLVLPLAALGGNVLQIGWLFTPQPLQPKLERISILQGLKRMVSLDRLFDLGKAFVKLGLAGVATWFALVPSLDAILALGLGDVMGALALEARLVRKLTFWILAGFAFFALLDLIYTRWRFEKKLKMTRQEVRDELKQREGDPAVRARLRTRARDLSRLRMIAEVAEADVVVTNPTHFAVALRYVRGEMSAPRVVARGRNHVAQRIISVARENGVPVVENPPLARLLYRTARLGQEIPETLYRAVAEVLAYITRLDPRRSHSWRTAP